MQYDSEYGTLPTSIRTGYKFTGWTDAKTEGNSITESSKVTIDVNHTLYAQWTSESNIIVTFDPN